MPPSEPYKQCIPPYHRAKTCVVVAEAPLQLLCTKIQAVIKTKITVEGQTSAGHWIFRAVARVYIVTGNSAESCQLHTLIIFQN